MHAMLEFESVHHVIFTDIKKSNLMHDHVVICNLFFSSHVSLMLRRETGL